MKEEPSEVTYCIFDAPPANEPFTDIETPIASSGSKLISVARDAMVEVNTMPCPEAPPDTSSSVQEVRKNANAIPRTNVFFIIIKCLMIQQMH